MARNSSSEFNALTEPPHPNKTKTQFNSVDEAIEAYKRGEFVIVMDDQDRENEGDLVLPACGVTAEQMAWMIKWTRWVRFVTLSLLITAQWLYLHIATISTFIRAANRYDE